MLQIKQTQPVLLLLLPTLAHFVHVVVDQFRAHPGQRGQFPVFREIFIFVHQRLFHWHLIKTSLSPLNLLILQFLLDFLSFLNSHLRIRILDLFLHSLQYHAPRQLRVGCLVISRWYRLPDIKDLLGLLLLIRLELVIVFITLGSQNLGVNLVPLVDLSDVDPFILGWQVHCSIY